MFASYRHVKNSDDGIAGVLFDHPSVDVTCLAIGSRHSLSQFMSSSGLTSPRPRPLAIEKLFLLHGHQDSAFARRQPPGMEGGGRVGRKIEVQRSKKFRGLRFFLA